MARRVPIALVLMSVLVALSAGVVGAVSVGRRDQPDTPTILRATGLPGGVVVADATTTTSPPAVSTTVVSTTTMPERASSTTIAPPVTRVPASSTTAVPTTSSTTSAVATSTTLAARPSSWSENANGVTIALRMEPAAPRAGDTVHFFYRATSSVEWCCLDTIYVNGVLTVLPAPMTGCADLSGEQEFTAVAPPSGLVVMVDAARGNICTLPPATLTSVRLIANVLIGPPR